MTCCRYDIVLFWIACFVFNPLVCGVTEEIGWYILPKLNIDMCMFCKLLFVLFILAIVLSVLLQYTDSDYPFGIFKLFLIWTCVTY